MVTTRSMSAALRDNDETNDIVNKHNNNNNNNKHTPKSRRIRKIAKNPEPDLADTESDNELVIVNITDSESDSNMDIDSDTEEENNVQTEEKDNEKEISIYRQFNDALNAEDENGWLNSPFHFRVWNTYTAKMLTFGPKQEKTPEEWLNLILLSIANGNDIKVTEVDRYVAICKTCDQYKNISKIVS